EGAPLNDAGPAAAWWAGTVRERRSTLTTVMFLERRDERSGGSALATVCLVLAAGACRPERMTDDLRIVVHSEIASLDPHVSSTVAAIEHLSNVYEPLVALDARLAIRPRLATSWESPDPTTWIFRLR